MSSWYDCRYCGGEIGDNHDCESKRIHEKREKETKPFRDIVRFYENLVNVVAKDVGI
jgi:hypothetical protein